MSVRKRITGVAMAVVMTMGLMTGAVAQTQDGLVNVSIGDVTILEDVDIDVAANVVANICANADVDAQLIVDTVNNDGTFECRAGNNGRIVAITD